MARGLDHIVHAVRDLDAAADLYRRLGFTVGARNKHPWGTHNHVVQLSGFFIELLTFAEPEKLGSDGFSTMFGAYNRDFIVRNEGFSLLILESKDAGRDAAEFSDAGIGAPDALRFEREAKRPDGTTVRVGFSLAFTEDRGARDIHFAACQQHYPENFWNPTFQQHPNGVTAVAGVVIVAEQPQQHQRFFQVLGDAQAVAVADGFAIVTPYGAIEVVTPAVFLRRFGVKAPDMSRGARLAALRLNVSSPSRLQALPELAGIAGLYVGNDAIIGSEDAMGAVLVFEPATRKPG
jgi:catechol 2,3-dioxygenase-like lactoylglutathione lyase family enzyme